MIRTLASTVVLCLIALSSRALSDVLVVENGREYEGVVLAQDENAIRFEAHHNGMRITLSVPRSNIRSLHQVDRSGTPYVRIPIYGRIGLAQGTDHFVTAEGVARALEHARRKNAQYVILHIDSGGGSVDEMQEILQVMQGYSDITFVAHVEQALSAAAIIALACEQIVMSRSARIGATVPWKMAPDGTPDNIEEKFVSTLRATVRSAARSGGHSVLLARGMMEEDLLLFAVAQDDGTVLITDKPSPEGRAIKQAGRVLTLTSSEAIECGLAVAEAASHDDALHAVNIDNGYEVDDLAWHMVINVARARARQIEHAKRRARQQAVRDEYVRHAYPRVQEIQARLNEVEAGLYAAKSTEAELEAQLTQELRAAKATYLKLQRRGSAAYAAEWYVAESARIKTRIHPQITTVRQRWRAALAERKLLVQELDGWIENTPKVE